ncbi:EamA family transporter [Candidatus Woesearchaeota archaeon]|nr:EamA family transporter [Candidatus Woesearchaeota archaeon]
MVEGLGWGIGLTVLSTFVGAVGALFLKFSISRKKGYHSSLISPYLCGGLLFYGLSALLFVFALRFGDLSFLYPFAALSYVWVAFLSVYFLQERITSYRWLGILFIMMGIILLGWGATI